MSELAPNTPQQTMNTIDKMDDEELSSKIVSDQIQAIIRIRKYAHNPLANPSRTPTVKQQQDAEWEEAIKRNLHTDIHNKVKEYFAIHKYSYHQEMPQHDRRPAT